MGKSFNRISGLNERRAISKAAKKASITAGRISKALDLPVQVIVDGKLIERSPDGSFKTIKSIERSPSNIRLKKGEKLWLGPKG